MTSHIDPGHADVPEDDLADALRQAGLQVCAQQRDEIRQGWLLLQPMLARLRQAASSPAHDKERGR